MTPVSSQLDPRNILGSKVCDDRYKVLTHLGSGSMGHVFRAYDSRLETDVVIKVPTLPRLEDEDFRRRFEQEASLLVRLTHPHIVKINDIGKHDGIPLVVMQYLSGGTLRDRMEAPDGRRVRMRAATLRDWLPQIAKALDFVHTQDSVHRDVKPTNILFDEHGNAFLADFGLTRLVSGGPLKDECDETAAGFVIGTANYVAPEIVLGEEYDGAADQYSLGLTVYEALAGKAPMRAKSASAAMVNQTQLVPKPLSQVSEKITNSVSQAVVKAISKLPEERFESCSEFADAIISAAGAVKSRKRKRPGSTTIGADTRVARTKRNTDDFDSNDDAYGYEQGRALPPRRGKKGKGPFTATARKQNTKSKTGKKSDSLVGKKSRGKPGLVSCPKCEVDLPIPASHAGQTGRCIHCNVRVKIGPRASVLKIVAEPTGSSAASKELIIGEKVFGLQLSRNVAIALTIGLSTILIGVLIGLFIWLSGEEKKPPMRSFESEAGVSVPAPQNATLQTKPLS